MNQKLPENILSDVSTLKQMDVLKDAGFIVRILENRVAISSNDGKTSENCYNRYQIFAFAKANGLYQDGSAPAPVETRLQRQDIQALQARIAELESTLSRLRERGRLAVAQRDAWEQRAMAAERRLIGGGTLIEPGRKFEQLKRFLAREFHPDNNSGLGFDRVVRTEIFKLIWSKVEEIERS